ncbi:hypothetical protein [Pseudobacteriovorax antillogorgiicola]|uniref:Secreted protein n=1 Tax=Pseudobacteriovorax antillogorgiicola TaxID=1513793 RepID=A0A1Y6BJD2_9BACT|nr:hypothetical protein [Pseudobacteriovorax antillogorgiicola]TCS56394.1 hypothetical protein EDD56_104216 [Pseudobacteriovorax antillogorgiicola]SMF06154.1 hypothetical protein SAMN06296036_104117 [Pseudobacteriovorax antillogorgiicola]
MRLLHKALLFTSFIASATMANGEMVESDEAITDQAELENISLNGKSCPKLFKVQKQGSQRFKIDFFDFRLERSLEASARRSCELFWDLEIGDNQRLIKIDISLSGSGAIQANDEASISIRQRDRGEIRPAVVSNFAGEQEFLFSMSAKSGSQACGQDGLYKTLIKTNLKNTGDLDQEPDSEPLLGTLAINSMIIDAVLADCLSNDGSPKTDTTKE